MLLFVKWQWFNTPTQYKWNGLVIYPSYWFCQGCQETTCQARLPVGCLHILNSNKVNIILCILDTFSEDTVHFILIQLNLVSEVKGITFVKKTDEA